MTKHTAALVSLSVFESFIDDYDEMLEAKEGLKWYKTLSVDIRINLKEF